MNKYTPAPWRARINQFSRWDVLYAGGVVTHLPQPNDPMSPPKTYEEAEANARLIAAAPDFLVAARAAIAYDAAIESCANDPSKMASFCSAQGDDLDTLYVDWIEKSRAAIAKATGAQP